MDARYKFADAITEGIDYGIDQILGTPTDTLPWILSATVLYSAGDLLKGYPDALKIGQDLPRIFSEYNAASRGGEWLQTALNSHLLTRSLFYQETPHINQLAALSLREGSRAALLLPFAGPLIKEAGAAARALNLGGVLRGGSSLTSVASSSRGVAFFDKEIADIVKTSGRLGRGGREVFYMPSEDAGGLITRSQIVRATGNADRVTQAYLNSKPFYGIDFPTTNLSKRLPDAIKYSENPNFLSGGRTAVALGKTGSDGLLVNRTREFVTDSFTIPKDSVLFRIDQNGRKVIIKRY